MKIAIVTEVFPKTSETFVLNHITRLLELKHDVNVYAFIKNREEINHPDVEKYKIGKKISYIKVPEKIIPRLYKALIIIFRYFIFHPRKIIACLDYKRYGGKYYALNNLFILASFLNKQYDVIHCHFGPIANKLLFLKDIFPDTRLIVTFHGYDIRLGLEKNDYYAQLFNKFDRVVSICQYSSEKLLELCCPKEKIVSIPNGINLNKFRKEETKNDNGLFIITTVARLVEEKNISFALKVINTLKKKGINNFEYHLVGDGGLKKVIEQEIDSLQLNQIVKMHGALPEDAVIKVLENTDIFFLPSRAEAFPTVLLEAQAMGIPVIATDIGGVKEALRDKITGYLIPSADVQEAEKRITELINNQNLLAMMGTAARRFVEENFNIKNTSKKMMETYTDSPVKKVYYA